MTRGKLLYVINHIDWFWSHRLPLALTAKNEGYDVHIAVAGAAQDPRFQQYGFTSYELTRNPFLIIPNLYKIFRKCRPDIIHAVTLKYAFFTGLATRLYPARTILTIAGLGYLFSDDKSRAKILRVLAALFMKIAFKGKRTTTIFQNPDDQALMIESGFVDASTSVLIRGSGIDTNQFPYSEEPDNDVPVILLPVRLLRDKGVIEFIEAMRILRQRERKLDCRIAGGHAGSNPLAISTEEMHALTADGASTWIGKSDDMPTLLKNCNIVVFPSYREGLPKTLLEASSTGRAIVTTDRPGCREAVTHGVNGLLVPVRDATAIADAVETLLDDKALRKKMGLAGRVRAEHEFAIEIVIAETLKVYSKTNS